MYTVREIPPNLLTDAQGLDLRETFTRIMALTERQYEFVRTGRRMHLLMTNAAPGEPTFESEFAVDAQARNAIMAPMDLDASGS